MKERIKNWFNWFREKIKNYGYLMTLAGSVWDCLQVQVSVKVLCLV